MFDKLVLNAFDFMRRAHAQIEDDPKASIIFFWTGLEQFVKARLMKEHWSLIVTKPQDADINKFRSGDFLSVSFEKAIDRLKKVSGSKVKDSDSNCFKILKEHRNRLVHFFSPEYSAPVNESIIQQAAAEQCLAWYYLHAWLTSDWRDEFANFSKQIAETHSLIRTNRKFLQAKYDKVLPSIITQQSQGKVFGDCEACFFGSALENEIVKQSDLEVLVQICKVCEYIRVLLRIQCPGCCGSIEIEGLGKGTCTNCETQVDMTYLLANFGEHGIPEDEMISPSNAYCSSCEYYEERSVIELKDGDYLCLNCLESFEQVSQCESCQEQISGEPEDTYFKGCGICTGRFSLD